MYLSAIWHHALLELFKIWVWHQKAFNCMFARYQSELEYIYNILKLIYKVLECILYDIVM